MADLLVDSGKHRGRRLKLALGETLIGRDKQCAIRLATPDVSRRHCRLVVQELAGEELVTAEDLGSRNGTYVNGRRIAGRTRLDAGDTVRVGPVQFLNPDPDAATASEVITWLVPPPGPGAVEEDEPTQIAGAAETPLSDEAAPRQPTPPPKAEPVDEVVLQAAAIIRAHRASA